MTTRLCSDRLRAPKLILVDDMAFPSLIEDLADALALADTVGITFEVALHRLTPSERVAFVLHDSFSFSFDFSTIAAILSTAPAAARKLASRARSKVRRQGV